MSTNFLLYPGTSNNGQLVSPFSVLTTEMNSLANAGTALSSVGGTSGVFNTSNTGHGWQYFAYSGGDWNGVERGRRSFRGVHPKL